MYCTKYKCLCFAPLVHLSCMLEEFGIDIYSLKAIGKM